MTKHFWMEKLFKKSKDNDKSGENVCNVNNKVFYKELIKIEGEKIHRKDLYYIYVGLGHFAGQ